MELQKNLEVREEIIRAALKVFAKEGYANADLNTIKLRSRVDDQTFAQHFPDRQSLFEACFKSFTREKAELVERALRPPETKEEFQERVRLFVYELVASHFENPYAYEIVHRETKANNPLADRCFNNSLKDVILAVVRFFEIARSKRFIRADLQPRVLSRLLLYLVEDVSRNDELSKKYFPRPADEEAYRDVVSDHIIRIFLEGISN